MSTRAAADRFELDHFRTVGDEALDDIFKRMGEELDGFRTVARLFPRIHDLVRMNADELGILRREDLVNDELIEFLAGFDSLPDRDWIDRETLHLGGEFYRSHGVLGFLVLACASLPACYCWENEAAVLGYTRKLSRRGAVPRRLPETAQFVIDVAAKGAFETDGTAIRAAKKVRLIHAIIRYLVVRPDSVEMAIRTGVILPDPGHDDPHHHHGDDWRHDMGAPISQEFLAGTLMTFSHVVLQGLRKLGIRAGAVERQAYLHRWNAVGYLLGIDERILEQIDSPEVAGELFDSIMERNRAPTEHGYSLAAALLDYQRNNVIARVTGGVLHPLMHVPAIVTRGLAGRKTFRALFLQLNPYEIVYYVPVWFGMKLTGLLNNLRVFRWLTERIIRYVSMHVWGWSRENQAEHQHGVDSGEIRPRGAIVIPSSLMDEWNLATADQPKSSPK